MALIEFNNFTFSYPGSDVFQLGNVNLSIEKSSFTLICGESGCGKTTFVKQLIPAIAPYGTASGEVRYNGKNLNEYTDEEIARNFGYVGQNPMDQTVTDKVWHELAFGMENLNTPQNLMERRIAEICEFFGLQKLLHRDVSTLSGGELSMVNLASVMVTEPKVLILDEPTAQLDPLASRNLLDMIKRINKELGTTVIIIEHHLEEVYGMADNIVVMSKAVVDYVGAPREVASKLNFREGLPSALVISKKVEELADTNNNRTLSHELPLTVAEGQKWLLSWCDSIDDVSNHVTRRNDFMNNEETSDEQSIDATPIIVMRNIAFTYDGEEAVLNECNLEVRQGEIFALMGGNGTGKSTLLKLLCMGINPSYGTIEVMGKKLGNIKSAPLGLGRMVNLPQDPKALFTEIKVADELNEALQGVNLSPEDKQSKVSGILERIGLNGYENQHPYDLSYGQMQMLALGKLLLLEPKIILMDEPTKGIDYTWKKKLSEILKELSDEGVTILMASHDIEFCARYASRLGLMHDGRVVANMTRREFFIGNSFFTTATNRIARSIQLDAILPEEVISFCREILSDEDN